MADIMRRALIFVLIFLPEYLHAAGAAGRIEAIEINSVNFDGNKVGVDPIRRAQVYLPPGYDDGEKRYAVLYGFATFFEDEKALFENYRIRDLLDAAIADGRLPPVIVVTPDFSTPAASSLFVDSPVTGRWETFMIEELVPAIDTMFRTRADRDSRGVFGNHIGGYGAIRFASRHPDTFGAVYALHPVATTASPTGLTEFLDWEEYFKAVESGDLSAHWSFGIFTAFFQAFLPNIEKPPLYADIPVRLENGERIVDEALLNKLSASLPLIADVAPLAENLKRLNGVKYDWGRQDPNEDHLRGNLEYSDRLRELEIPHVAESYNGGWDEFVFNAGGRIDTDLFPFFVTSLDLEPR